MKKLFLTLKILAAVIAVLFVVVLAYLLYVICSYERLPDKLDCNIDRAECGERAELGKDHRHAEHRFWRVYT